MKAMTEPEPRTASPLQVAKAVFWSFFGVRRRAEHERDIAQIKPVQVVIAGLVGALIFVLSLVLLVKFILSKAA
jgi:predicted Na+-dependent transporter